MESDEEFDEIYDEIDRYHLSLDIADQANSSTVSRRPEEVLNVEGDSHTEESDDDKSSSTFSDSVIAQYISVLPSADKWGNSRKGFYHTSYVDEDWGGMNEAEVELAELEEEDAVTRQKKLDAALNHIPMQFQQELQEVDADSNEVPSVGSMTSQEKLEFFLKLNSDLKELYDEYHAKRIYFLANVIPLLDLVTLIRNKSPGIVLEKQIAFVVNIFSRYLMNLLFAIRIKVVGYSKHEVPQFIDHPILQAIPTIRNKVLTAEHYLEKNGGFQILRSYLESISSETVSNSFRTFPSIKERIRNPSKKKHEKEGEVVSGRDDVLQEVKDKKRAITSQIEKNRGLQNKRKKGTQHSRVKKRKQFQKALVKKHSQKADVRRELAPYGGEYRGIRASVVKSVKLKA
ncbi:unnamed protein product [Thelazia callipaeda]|uniref:Sas10 domain-containing protein n=1 Tax=Thelazia callipaeda TaxID=103827 RepID=A0A0N5CLB3_THECL|nr:unnamed protein product [Thelazia callipaeda]